MANQETPERKVSAHHGANGQASILSISYDAPLLHTREWILKGEGFRVTSACGFTEGQDHACRGGFDLAVMGHSIPHRDKIALITAFKTNCNAPVLSLVRHGDEPLPPAEYSVLALNGPEAFVKAVRTALNGKRLIAGDD